MPEPREPSKRRRTVVREPPERLPWLRYDRMARAVTERLRVRPVPGQPFWVLAVHNPVHHTRYQVCLPEFPSGEAQFCSCEDFARRGIGTCKHVEAATAWLESHPEVTRPPASRLGVSNLWRDIDAARKDSESPDRPVPVRIRLPGRVLFERGAASHSNVGRKREGEKVRSSQTGDRAPSSTSRALP
jgi:hypothetical protein